MFTEGICQDGAAILNDGVMVPIDEIIDLLNAAQDMERNYTHQLGEMARLCDIVCPWVIRHFEGNPAHPAEVLYASAEIMQYVDAVRPGECEKKTEWVMHILGPDDVIPCVGEFDALRKANQHNKAFAKLMTDDPSPNDPYCVALAESV